MDGYLLLGEGAGERGLLGVGDAARAEPLPLRHVAAHNKPHSNHELIDNRMIPLGLLEIENEWSIHDHDSK